MTSTVVEMTSGTSLFAWLCDNCIAFRIAAGWTVKRKNVVAFGCDDCSRKHEVATPPVDYVPTAPGSFCPPPGWVAPTIPETWTARLARLQKGQVRR